jgi:dephospho-CoA kinase
VAALLAARGARIVDSDHLAREVVAPGTGGLAEVAAHFGPEVLRDDGSLDRERLGAIIFGDDAERHALEAITHPRIRKLTAKRVAAALAEEPPLVVVDIPLLFEVGHERDLPGVLLVYAGPETQLRRLMARDGLDERAAQQRLDAQMPIEAKRDRATWVIDNSGDRGATEQQVDSWWRQVVGSG